MEELYDAVVLGGGPAGLTAALYLARARCRVAVVEKERFGGQIALTHEVVNFPGVARTSGEALSAVMKEQARSFGAELLLAEAERLSLEGEVKTVYTSRGPLRCFGLLLATGAHPRQVGFQGEEEFRGRGVAYCATCDGAFFAGREVFVIGGGYAAAEEGIFLTKYARKVTILIRGEDFSCARSVADAARAHEGITVLTHVQVEQVGGDTLLRSIRWRDTVTGQVTEHRAAEGDHIGVFVFVGYAPATDLIAGLAERDEQGYVRTDRALCTTVPGLYAAGDVCIKPLRQVVTAVGDGALAATGLERYAAAMEEKTGLHPRRPAAPAPAAPAPEADPAQGQLLSPDDLAQLETVFHRMAAPLVLRLRLDDRPVSAELRAYMTALAARTDKLTVEEDRDAAGEGEAPCVQICRADGSWSGLAFHGVPGGHEFTAFVLGLYNVAGPGQPLEPALVRRIQEIRWRLELKVLISLSCTLCPDLVIAAQRLAAENSHITARVYDLSHFPQLQERYQVMSVPCLVVNDGAAVSFGKKSIEQLLELLQRASE